MKIIDYKCFDNATDACNFASSLERNDLVSISTSAKGGDFTTYVFYRREPIVDNTDIAASLGILDDLLENNSAESINRMAPETILAEWLNWEGIIGYLSKIITIYESFKNNRK